MSSIFVVAAGGFGVLAAIIAYNKGRSSLGWFICGLILGPFAMAVATLPPVPKEGLFAACPVCREVIRVNAQICRHCGSRFEG